MECAQSELAAILQSSAALGITSAGYYIEFSAGSRLLKGRVDALTKRLYGITSSFAEAESTLKNQTETFRLTGEKVPAILGDCAILGRDEDGLTRLSRRIDHYLVMEEKTIRAYLSGAFLAAGGITVPPAGDGTTGYHLEIAVASEALSRDLAHLMAEEELSPKCTRRRGKYVVYIKNREEISDMLAALGAGQAVLSLQKVIAARDMRNSVTRQTNCIGANIDRTVSAAERQLAAIRTIEEKAGLQSLPEELRALCVLRKASPELSIKELAAALPGGISKGGVNHRLERIIKIAEELNQKQSK